MRKLVQSLKSCYTKGSKWVTLEKLNSMKSEGTITEEEYNYIISE